MESQDPEIQLVQGGKCTEPIDVVVPTHNKLELTIKCMDALYTYTTAPFHLIVVDDSTDRITPIYFEELMKQHDNITFIHSDVPYKSGNQFFNIAFAQAKTQYVATVMNSLRVEPEWELVAIDLMKKDPKIGIVGLKSLFAWDSPGHGMIESAGITMIGFTPVDIGKGMDSHRHTSIYECPAVQWAFAIVRKEAATGNMCEDVFNGFRGWDDIDNCFVLRKNGWKVVYCGYGAGFHSPRATRGSNNEKSHLENLQNAKAFYKRWGYWEQYVKEGKERFGMVGSGSTQEKVLIKSELDAPVAEASLLA